MTTRRVFFSFHYAQDNWRAGQVRNMGLVEGNAPVSDNDWEEVTRGGAAAIERWIGTQMYGKSCAIVLIGANTAGRKWVKYEIEKAWNDGKGVLGIYIHNLKNQFGNQSNVGANPFKDLYVNGVSASTIVRDYDPPFADSSYVYAYIRNNIADWVEEAIGIRRLY